MRPTSSHLADTYSMSDNFHQSVKGGTGANHIMLGTADAIWFSNGKAQPTTPPDNPVNPTAPGTPSSGFNSALSEIENPDPQPGTNNYYTQDGYGGGSGKPTAASPARELRRRLLRQLLRQIAAGRRHPRSDYLKGLPNPVKPKCQDDHYYLVNNYNPGLFRRRHQRLYRQQPEQHCLHDPAVERQDHRRSADREQRVVGSITATNSTDI